MTQKFEIGEVAILQNAKFHQYLNGEECIVVVGLAESGGVIGYLVHTVKEKKFLVYAHQLRKKRGIDMVVNWKDCAWSPRGVKQ